MPKSFSYGSWVLKGRPLCCVCAFQSEAESDAAAASVSLSLCFPNRESELILPTVMFSPSAAENGCVCIVRRQKPSCPRVRSSQLRPRGECSPEGESEHSGSARRPALLGEPETLPPARLWRTCASSPGTSTPPSRRRLGHQRVVILGLSDRQWVKLKEQFPQRKPVLQRKFLE